MFRRKRVTVLVLVALLSASEASFGWGPEGHMAVNRVAAQHLPGSMPAFLRQATERLVYLGPEPDRWRNKAEWALKEAQEPDHFIDLERIDWMGPLPPDRYQFYRSLYDKRASGVPNPDQLLPERVGLQPYITMEVYDRLKIAFRDYRRLRAARQPTGAVEQNIVFYAGWLGHYVADGSQPLHTTIHFDGWVGDNPKGYTTDPSTHWSFEGPFVARNLAKLEFSALVKAPARLQDPFQDYVRYLRDTHAQVEEFYRLEKKGAFHDTGTAEGLAFTRERLAAGAQMLLDLWYTAWLESEKPV